jgi:hypothetical protein
LNSPRPREVIRRSYESGSIHVNVAGLGPLVILSKAKDLSAK